MLNILVDVNSKKCSTYPIPTKDRKLYDKNNLWKLNSLNEYTEQN